MTQWEYAQIDFSALGPKQSELNALNAAGDAGWELVQVLPPHRAILKRRMDAPHRSEGEISAKYRDPETGQTWSGRGRMATWLAMKLRAGEALDDYRIPSGGR